jgi:hypothetical protein
LFAIEDALAATRTWTGASIKNPNSALRNNFWTDPFNWSGNVAPVAGDDLVFTRRANTLPRSAANQRQPASAWSRFSSSSKGILTADYADNSDGKGKELLRIPFLSEPSVSSAVNLWL